MPTAYTAESKSNRSVIGVYVIWKTRQGNIKLLKDMTDWNIAPSSDLLDF